MPMPQNSPSSAGNHLFNPSSLGINQNYALMAQQQLAAMQAAMQSNPQAMRGFPGFPGRMGLPHMRQMPTNFGKNLPFNIAPFMAAAYNLNHQRPASFTHGSAGSDGNAVLSNGGPRFNPSKGLPGSKMSLDELMKQVNRQIGSKRPENEIASVDN